MRNLFKKYSKIFKKISGNILRKRITWKKKIKKALSLSYLLFFLPIEIIGDLFTFKKFFFFKKIPKPKKILIIKIDQFGDVLFSTFLISLIRKEYPEIEIHYLIHPKTEVLLKKNPYINKIYFWQDLFLFFILGREENKKNSFFKILKENYQVLKELRKEKYDLIINTRAFAPSSNFFLKIMNPKFLIAFDISEQSFLADVWAEYDFYEEEWKNCLKLIQPFLELKKVSFSPQFFNFGKLELKEKKFLDNMNNLVLISPITFDKERLWGIKNWQETIKYLIKKGYSVVLTGIKSQEGYLREITQIFNSKNEKEKVKIDTCLIPQLANLIKVSKFTICIESFPAHLSIALKKPLICLINLEIYFLKNFSKKGKFFSVGKSMIPLIENVKILSVLDANADDLINKINEII